MKRLLLMSLLTLLSGLTLAQTPTPAVKVETGKPVKPQFGPLGSDQLRAIQGVGQALLAAKHSESNDADYQLLRQRLMAIQEKTAQAQRESLRIDSSKAVITSGGVGKSLLPADVQVAKPPMKAERELHDLVQATGQERVALEKRLQQSGAGRQPLLRSLMLTQLKDMEAAANQSEGAPLEGRLTKSLPAPKIFPAKVNSAPATKSPDKPTFATIAKHRPLPRANRLP